LAGAVTAAIRPHAVTGRLREATLHLEAVEGRVRSQRMDRRRALAATAVAALVAAGLGFAIGRSRPRRSTLFRPPR
jgi:hypothetical protein